MQYQLFVPTFRTEECLQEIKECLDRGWTGLGYKTVEFENAWMEYTGFKHAHFLNSATAGLHLAVKILKEYYGWSDGDEVISTPITFVSTNHAISYEGLHVVFADVDKYLCLDPEDVINKITSKTKAIIFVGYGGSTGQYKKIVKICEERNIKLILDAAHMSGTRLNGEIVGRDADVAIFSFQAVKNLPTADSGMICFKEKVFDEIVRKYTWLGINKDTYSRTGEKGNYKWKYDVDYLGYKYHGNSIMAAIALAQLKYLDVDNAYRRQLAKWYDDAFLNEMKVKPVMVPEGCESSRHIYAIEVADRDNVLGQLNDKEIYPGVHYRDNTEYSIYSYGKGTCPYAHYIAERVMSLPMHLKLGKSDVDFIADTIKKIMKESVSYAQS